VTRRISAAYAGVTALLFLGVAACQSGASGQSEKPSSSSIATAHADLDSAARRWSRLDRSTQDLVCLQALERGGPDYQGMLRELTTADISQPEAAAMLPYAANECH
jgi:hypothetical protein